MEAKKARENTKPTSAGKALSQTRLIAIIPAVGLALSAFVLVINTFIEVVLTCADLAFSGRTSDGLTIELIEYTDQFLFGVVLFMTALGLCQLFVYEKVPLPKWLTFHDLDDLKERLISVIVVMLCVHFLGMVLKSTNALDLLWLGLGISAVVFVLTLFTKGILHHGE